MSNVENTFTFRKGGCLFSLIKLAIIAIIVLTIALYFTAGYIGDYALKTITSGTEITGGIGNINVKPLDESVEVKNFYITNPTKKYNKENAVSFDRAFIALDINPSDVIFKKLIVVDEITIEGLNADIEFANHSLTKTNLNEISDIIQSKLGLNTKDSKDSQKKTSTQEDETPVKFIIKKLKFKNGNASSSILGNVIETQLPDFEIENIGVESGGKTIGEIIVYVLPRIASQATQQITKKGWKTTIKTGDESAESVKKLIKGLFN